jgi:hypothetical protein
MYGTFESGFCASNFFADFRPFVFLLCFLAFIFFSCGTNVLDFSAPRVLVQLLPINAGDILVPG